MHTQMPLNKKAPYEHAYTLFINGQYKQAEILLLQLTSQSLDQNDYISYVKVSSLLNRVYINSLQYKLLGKNLLTLTDYLHEYANEEQKLKYRLHTAIFNYYYKIGNFVSELEELYEDLYKTHYLQLTATTTSFLILVYLELHKNKKAIDLVQKTYTVTIQYDNPNALFAHQIYTFFAYYSLRQYKESAAILSEIEPTPNIMQLSHFSALYSAAKALQIAQEGHIEQAKQLFNEVYASLANKEYIRLAIGYWVDQLLQNGFYKEAAMYQQLHVKMLEKLFSPEISILRNQVIEERSKKSYEHLAFYDGLTGVYNRNYYEWLTKRKIKSAQYTLVVIDFDLFKKINDTGGHTKGDEAIQLVARLLQRFIDQYPDARTIRYGGDEFLLCMPYVYSDVSDAITALHTHILSQYVSIQGKPLYLSISMGIAYTETVYSSIRDLFEVADVALYEAKQKRGAIVCRCVHE